MKKWLLILPWAVAISTHSPCVEQRTIVDSNGQMVGAYFNDPDCGTTDYWLTYNGIELRENHCAEPNQYGLKCEDYLRDKGIAYNSSHLPEQEVELSSTSTFYFVLPNDVQCPPGEHNVIVDKHWECRKPVAGNDGIAPWDKENP